MSTTLAPEPQARPAFVDTQLRHIVPMAARPRVYTFDPPEGEPQTNATYQDYPVRIHDLRQAGQDFTLDQEGFALLRHQSAVAGFTDEDEIRRVYYPESAELIGRITGADRVFIFDHTIRRRVAGATDRAAGVPRQPATHVHVDHTAKSGPQRVRDLLGEDAEALLKGRVQIINLWRPIRGPLFDAPLALADARSVSPSDLVPSDLVYRNRVGETYGVAFNPAHRWYYASGMQPDEALLIKCYDSETDGRARFVPHGAFDDPSAPADRLPRESIELRSLVFHKA